MSSPHRGRVQAQGAGTEKSVPWAQQQAPTKGETLERLDELEKELTPQELADRETCFADARRYIENAPPRGINSPFSKSFLNRKRAKEGVRVDLEIKLGVACVDDV